MSESHERVSPREHWLSAFLSLIKKKMLAELICQRYPPWCLRRLRRRRRPPPPPPPPPPLPLFVFFFVFSFVFVFVSLSLSPPAPSTPPFPSLSPPLSPLPPRVDSLRRTTSQSIRMDRWYQQRKEIARKKNIFIQKEFFSSPPPPFPTSFFCGKARSNFATLIHCYTSAKAFFF